MITAIPQFARSNPSQTTTRVNLINCCRRKLLCVWFSWNVAVALKFLLDRSKHVMELSDKWRRESCDIRIISFPLVLGSLSFFAVLSLVFKYYPWRVPDFLLNAGMLKLSVVSFLHWLTNDSFALNSLLDLQEYKKRLNELLKRLVASRASCSGM